MNMTARIAASAFISLFAGSTALSFGAPWGTTLVLSVVAGTLMNTLLKV